jgi:hypothetical protein
MPKMSFTSNNRVQMNENFPKLSLAQGESARIVVFEAPEAAFVHNLRAPKIVDGVVVYSRDAKGNEVMEYEFIGNPLCLGSEENLEKGNGLDVRNCPACKAASEYGIDMFQAPKRRYAMHIFQYQTNGSAKAPTSFEGSVKVWSFADGKFNELIDVNETLDGAPMAEVDLLLGPCEHKMYQKYKMIPSRGQAAYLAQGAKQRFEEVTAANKSADIYRYIGRKMGKELMEDKVAEVVRKHRQARGQASETSSDNLAGTERDLDAGLANLLDDTTPAKPQAAVTTPRNDEPADFEDILNNL